MRRLVRFVVPDTPHDERYVDYDDAGHPAGEVRRLLAGVVKAAVAEDPPGARAAGAARRLAAGAGARSAVVYWFALVGGRPVLRRVCPDRVARSHFKGRTASAPRDPAAGPAPDPAVESMIEADTSAFVLAGSATPRALLAPTGRPFSAFARDWESAARGVGQDGSSASVAAVLTGRLGYADAAVEAAPIALG
jgi:hypothetical protein